jgi:hypothetical protein
MDESEWNACTDPDELLHLLADAGWTSDRKLRLFACACCRRIWKQITERCSRRAVQVSERYADGRATFEQLEAAFLTADRVRPRPRRRPGRWSFHALDAARLAAHPEMRGLADETALAAGMAAAEGAHDFWKDQAREQVRQCDLLRDVFGPLPFRRVPIDAAWLAWNDGTVRRLAEAAYAERQVPAGTLDPARLGVLADALEEAGCTQAELLDHLRGPGPHVRGCWPVDLLTGRQ